MMARHVVGRVGNAPLQRGAGTAHAAPAYSISAIVAAGLITWAFAFTIPRGFTVGAFVDDAYYAVLAKSIREQGAYRTIHLPDAPAETKYPPLYPAALALAWDPDLDDATNLDRSRWVNLILVGPLASALTSLGVTFGLAPITAAALGTLGVIAPATARLWVIPLSEPLFLLALTLGLMLLSRGRSVWGMALLVVATYARTIGIVFVVGTLLVLVRRNNRRSLRLLACAGIGLLPWFGWQAINGGAVPDFLLGLHGSYARWYLDTLLSDPLTVLLVVPAKNALDMIFVLGEFLFRAEWLDGWFRTWFPWLGSIVVLGVVGFLLWRVWTMRTAAPWLVAGLIAYAVVTIAWPYPVNRFVAGAWPLVLVTVGASLRRRADVLALTACLSVGIGLAREESVLFHRIRSRIADQMVTNLAARMPTAAVLATTNPPLHYLRLGVPTVPSQSLRSHLGYRTDTRAGAWGLAQDVWPILDHYRPEFIAVERRGNEGTYAIEDLDAACPGLLVKEWESVDGELLYRVSYDVAQRGGARCRVATRVSSVRGDDRP